MTNITRQEWGADSVALESISVPVDTVFLHHTATKASSNSKTDMKNIESGEQTKGYSTVAYTACGHPNGDVLEGRILNGVIKKGAATLNNNSTSLAYCFIGNFMTDTLTPQAFESACQTIAGWVSKGWVKNTFKLRLHKEVFATACPGTNIISQLARIKSRIDEILKGEPMGLTSDEFNYIHILASGGLPGAGYDGRYTGKGLTETLHAVWGPDPLAAVSKTLAYKVKAKELIKPSECPSQPPAEIDVDAIAEAVADKLAERLKD